MTQPPDYPGRRRVKRAAASAAGDAYQGAFEAVMAVLVGAGAGYWVDRRWGTTPYGVIVGLVVGFAAMVLRLMRMRSELPPTPLAGTEPGGTTSSTGSSAGAASAAGTASGADPDRGPAEMPGVDDLWREDASDERERD